MAEVMNNCVLNAWRNHDSLYAKESFSCLYKRIRTKKNDDPGEAVPVSVYDTYTWKNRLFSIVWQEALHKYSLQYDVTFQDFCKSSEKLAQQLLKREFVTEEELKYLEATKFYRQAVFLRLAKDQWDYPSYFCEEGLNCSLSDSDSES